MTWVTPTTKGSTGKVDYTTWVDEIVQNVNELYHRRADSMGSHLQQSSTGVAAFNTALPREMRAIEIGGIEDWTSLDTVEGDSALTAGGGPGDYFEIPKGYTGLWRFSGVGGSTVTDAVTIQLMWSFNSTIGSTLAGFPAMSTTPEAWTYQWCMGSMGIFTGPNNVGPAGIVLDRFTSGDRLRFYTVGRVHSGSTVLVNHGAGLGGRARLWAQFLGTTV